MLELRPKRPRRKKTNPKEKRRPKKRQDPKLLMRASLGKRPLQP